MKLIIAGATGLLGTEIVRQSLQIPDITQVIALSCKPIQLDEGADSSKLKSVLIRDYGEYPDDVKAEFTGVDACIWTVSPIPLQTDRFGFSEVSRAWHDYTKIGFEAMYEAGPVHPFRFMYVRTEKFEDSTWKPVMKVDYQVMRRNTELTVLKFPTEKEGVEVCIAQPGVIVKSTIWSTGLMANICRIINIFGRPVPEIYPNELAAAVLNQVMDGFEKETLLDSDLVRIGQKALDISQDS
ncbi:hypothetical protein N7457_005524 [Penicillium paradoxum]|uniref:uncharacterized protein n=1 Tax=Penicillium paradoxum TaxID=176176 RepID=UPI0025499445|nr:uncharacterized protein N7457_005524 [Penicillium paradoxum]KAJ5780364.1 hypothetical protein N7457_005524 [Penicillium paradoxum]